VSRIATPARSACSLTKRTAASATSDLTGGFSASVSLDQLPDVVAEAAEEFSAAAQSATGATGILDLVKFEQAYIMLKGVIGLDHKLGRQYYGDAGDMVIYYGPLMMPYTRGLAVTGLDGWTGWWKDGKWTANALVAKQTQAAVVANAGRADTNVNGLVAGYAMNDNMNLGAYFYQKAQQKVGFTDDNLQVAGVKAYGKCPITGINYRAEFAQNMGKNTTVATGEAAAGHTSKYQGSAVKVDLNRDQKFMGNWNFMGEYAMGTGRGEGSTDGMMTAQDVADTVLYCVTRPRSWRVLTMSYVENLLLAERRRRQLPTPTLPTPQRRELIDEIDLEPADPGIYDRLCTGTEDDSNGAT